MKKVELLKIANLLKIKIIEEQFSNYFQELKVKEISEANQQEISQKEMQKLFALKCFLQNKLKIDTNNFKKEFEFIDNALLNCRITLLNQQKNLHIIWNGKISEIVTDYIRVIAYAYPDFSIKIWTDTNAFLLNVLRKKITENSNSNADAVILQNSFNKLHKIKNNLVFDEVAKEFLLEKLNVSENEIEKLYSENKASFKLAANKFVAENLKNIRFLSFSDLEEWNNPSNDWKAEYIKNYYLDQYLRQSIVAGSDFFRIYVLNEQGGIYMDPDILPLLNTEKWANSFSFYINDKKKNINNNLYQVINKQIEILKNYNENSDFSKDEQCLFYNINKTIILAFKSIANNCIDKAINSEKNEFNKIILEIVNNEKNHNKDYSSFFKKYDSVSYLNNFSYFPGSDFDFNCLLVSLKNNDLLYTWMNTINYNFKEFKKFNFENTTSCQELTENYKELVKTHWKNSQLMPIINSRFESFISTVATTVNLVGGRVLFDVLPWSNLYLINNSGYSCSYFTVKESELSPMLKFISLPGNFITDEFYNSSWTSFEPKLDKTQVVNEYNKLTENNLLAKPEKFKDFQLLQNNLPIKEIGESVDKELLNLEKNSENSQVF